MQRQVARALEALGHADEEAIRQAEDAIATWREGALEAGETPPAPRAYPSVSAAIGTA